MQTAAARWRFQSFRIALAFAVAQFCEPAPSHEFSALPGSPREFRAWPGHAAALSRKEEFVSWVRQQRPDSGWFRGGPVAYCADLSNCSIPTRLAIHCDGANSGAGCDFYEPRKSICSFSEEQFLEALPSAIGELCHHDGDLCNATDSSADREGMSMRE